jgi:iron complex transport system permease protein
MALKTTFSWSILLLLLVFLFLADLSFGSVSIPLQQVFMALTFQSGIDPVIKDIILDFRMTKALTCVLAGSGLAVAGLQMQTLFRNPLAGPDVLGLSSGASLAVSLIFMGGFAGLGTYIMTAAWAVAIAATLGAATVFLIMYVIARRLQDNASLLIVGLMIGAGTSSIVSVLQYLSKAEELQIYVLWTFGSLGGLNWTELQVLALIIVIGSVVAILTVKSLNAWLLGDHYAQSVGVDIKKSRLHILLSTSILTGGVTAFCGPIAFVGLAVPHLVKLLVRTTNHKVLIPAVFLGGASLLLFCDILSQLPGEYILPINAITAMIGAPVVIWVILRKKFLRH